MSTTYSIQFDGMGLIFDVKMGEVAEKVSAHLQLFPGYWKLSRLLLLSVLFPTLSLLIPNLTLQIWVMGDQGSVIGE